ncbi:MAG: bifunctional [glutamine synthetase] adenylyltransferase/[glutamine synthetase]-adenylyl-L-tyrosine phosphorylase, partial [Candidatus Nanopelagicales bacterium]|nr:bifunctional [glutamine synthetase] adenylyltransferase/[glutamine synthetase]-adenylyl-L-tyrosine phosphorylase [Candidatus Nanopelagicales bacterium]
MKTFPGNSRSVGPTADLARLGFLETERAASVLSGKWCGFLSSDNGALDDLGLAADPDLALLSLERILAAEDPRAGELQQAFDRDPVFRRRLVLVLGASAALGEHLVRHPADWVSLTDEGGAGRPPSRDEVIADLRSAVAGQDEEAAALALRVAYRRRLLALAARDLDGTAIFSETTGELADLADAVLAACLDVGRAGSSADISGGFSVIALGKCGGRELNYVSDVDVVFVADEADDRTTCLARTVMRMANEATAEGSIWQIDAGLRPEGKSGALVRTLASYLSYYKRWADTWEFQALLKARSAAGDAELGNKYVEATRSLVWSAADRPGFVAEVQAMRRRVEDHVPADEADWQLKLGRGGLRDVEFSVQLLQLVHGRTDLLIRSSNTLEALSALATWGYVGRDDAATMADAYEFLRRLEHRVQLFRLQRTAVVPNDPKSLRRLGRAMGFRRDPAEQLISTWRAHARSVRRLHEKLFYRPLLDAVAALGAGEVRLSREAAVERLTALGYVDPDGALLNIEALTSGISRRAVIQRTLLPVMLGWFADGPDPDAGLLGFRRVSEALGATPWYLRLLRDESAVARRLADLLSTSRFASDLLLRVPEFVASLGDEELLRPRRVGQIFGEMGALASRNAGAVECIAAVRSVRRRELLRLAVAEIERLVEVSDVGSAISAVTDAAIDRA